MSSGINLTGGCSFSGFSDAGHGDLVQFLATNTHTKLKSSILAGNWDSIEHNLKIIADFTDYMRSKLPSGSLVYDELCTLIEQDHNEFVFLIFDLLNRYGLSKYPDNFLEAACIFQLINTDEFKNRLSRFQELMADLSQNPNESLNQLKILIEQKNYPKLTALYCPFATYLSQIYKPSTNISLEQAMGNLKV